MGRTTGPDDAPSRSKRSDRGQGHRSGPSRTVVISKALSRLLRHQAVNEGIPITSDGWVRLDHLLAWKGLSSRNGVNPAPTIEEIWDVVEDNNKKRFAVRWIGKDGSSSASGVDKAKEDAATEAQDQPSTTIEDLVEPLGQTSTASQGTSTNILPSANQAKSVLDKAKSLGFASTTSSHPAESSESASASTNPEHSNAPEPETQADSETSRAIAIYRTTNPHPPASEFHIRAVQGHSIQTVASDASLLQPITLDNPASIPETCVHGTFYGAWPTILRSGGLKRMGRNHVHFASGPTLAETGVTGDGPVAGEKSDAVISGMRSDAQLLIYIDLKRCMEDVKEKGAEMLWWRSENGVILTEGVEPATREPSAPALSADAGDTVKDGKATETNTMETPEDSKQETEGLTVAETAVPDRDKGRTGRGKKYQGKGAQAQAQDAKNVPMEYWSVVVDVKGGHGVIWRQGEGVVKELPEELTSRGIPKGRGGGRGRGRGIGK